MTLATLFSGIGAPEFAAREVSDEVKTIFACEIDKFARLSYLANHDAPLSFYEDVCDLDARPYAGKIDILIGGSPCQDFSIAGQRAGENGERGNLIWQFYRIVSEARPSVFIYENVKGFLSIDSGKSYQSFLDALRGLGYHCHAEVLNTKDYGIPQNRERLYIVGFLNADEYHAFSYAPKQTLELNLGDMLDREVDEKYFLSDRALAHFRPKDANESIANTLTTNPGHRRTDAFIKVAGELDIPTFKRARQIYDTDGVSPTLLTAKNNQETPKVIQRSRWFNKGAEFELCPTISSNSFEQNNLLKSERTVKCFKKEVNAFSGGIKVIGKLDIKGNDIIKRVYDADGVAPTIHTAQGGNQEPKILQRARGFNKGNEFELCPTISSNSFEQNNLLKGERIRKLTPRECLRLQGFPESFKIVVSDTQAYKQAGNAMSINVVKMIFEQIKLAKNKDFRLGA